MKTSDDMLGELNEILLEKFGERLQDFILPPPVFAAMRGELIDMDLQHGSMTASFPVQESYLNPYGAMQGGMIAAAVDNTLGPLSIAIAPPNVTRRLEMKFSRPVTLNMAYILVQAKLVSRDGPMISFEARVSSPDGYKLATCKAVHWIIDNKT